MSAILMDGRFLAQQLKALLQSRITTLMRQDCQPGLAVIIVGENPASQVYVRMKVRQCESLGIRSFQHFLPEETSQLDLQALIQTLNIDPRIHGILLQLPVPDHLDADTLVDFIDPSKDIDGLTKTNMGALVRGDETAFVPCTPKGCLKLLRYYLDHKDRKKKFLAGKYAVIIGRSHLVGKPLIQLLLQEDCTVSVVHSQTRAPEILTREADIVIVAVGRPGLVKASWIKPGAVVIDVGINRLQQNEESAREGQNLRHNNASHKGDRAFHGTVSDPTFRAPKSSSAALVGDIVFDEIQNIAGYVTPVPGGVGPMTVACLLENTIEAAERSCRKKTEGRGEI